MQYFLRNAQRLVVKFHKEKYIKAHMSFGEDY